MKIKLKNSIPIVIVLLFLIAFPHFASSKYTSFAIWGFIGAIWTLGLNFFFGYCGMINFGTSAFGCIAGYTFALLVTRVHIPNIAAIIVAIIATALVSYAVGALLIVRLRHLVLGLATLAFAMSLYVAVRSGFSNWTHGEDGISIPALIFGGKKMGDFFYYYVFLIIVVLGYFIAEAILHSRTGRAMISIREDEEAARAMGVNVNRTICLAFLLNAIYSAFAATLYVQWSGWVSPEFYGLTTTVLVLLGVALGGIGSPLGALIGGVFIFILPQLLITFAKFHTLVYGTVLALLLRFAPGGIAGAWRFLANRIAKKNQRGIKDVIAEG